MGKCMNPEVQNTLAALVSYLQTKEIEIILETQCLPDLTLARLTREQLPSAGCHLLMVVGGDGSLLDAARLIVNADIPVIGINRGRRGFLTDISPQAMIELLEPILQGEYQEERRFLLEMQLWRNQQLIAQESALNDIVLYSLARTIDFEVRIDQQFAYRQRSDGLITATPTGSTAHALSAGGPIVYPALEAIILVPMYPLILSSRPLVVNSQAHIELQLLGDHFSARLSCDGQIHFDIHSNDKIIIRRKAQTLRLIHPLNYDYYHTLRSKLGWSG